jgi:AAHS family 4-hydroxybenzoate transporter-like MFS transporter
MQQAITLDLQRLIDERPWSRFQLWAGTLCGAIALMDGYDAQSMGYVAPAMSADLHIARAALGPLLSSGLAGMVIGALAFGPIADRMGRKPVLIISTLIFSLMSLATATATTLETISLFRILTGFGLGGALPNTIALTSEFTPKKHRATAVTTMMCGFTLGAAFGGFVAAALISRFGWQSVFVVGGVVPLLIAIITAAFLPESIRFLALKRPSDKRLAHYVRKIAPGAARYDALYMGSETHKSGVFVVKELFMEGRAKITLLLWICFFMNLMLIFFLNSWLPTVIADNGINVRTAILITSLFQVGGTVGAIILGWVCDRGVMSPFNMLGFVYLGAAATTILIGQSGASIAALIFTVTAAGFCVTGGQTASNAVAAGYYPTPIRSTGVGWCLGIGRFGSIIGPVLGGALLISAGSHAVFWIIAVPALIAMTSAFVAGRNKPRI